MAPDTDKRTTPRIGACLRAVLKDGGIGMLAGAVLLGLPLSLIHLLYNETTSPMAAIAALFLFVVLYGLWAGAAFVLVSGLLRVLPLPLRLGRQPPARHAACLFGVALIVLFLFYGRTYEQVPLFEPATAAGMGLVVLVAVALVSAVSVLAIRVVAVWLERRAADGRLRRLVVASVAVAVVLHLALPVLGREWREPHAGRYDPAALVARPGPPVALLGFDGMDPDLLLEFIEGGQLPHLSEFVRNGTFSRLETIPGANSAVLWASIYGGEAPTRHGIRDFYRVRFPGSGAGLFPVHRTFFKELIDALARLPGLSRRFVSRLDLPSPPIWEIADRAGLATTVVDGYFYSFPAQPMLESRSRLLAYGVNEALTARDAASAAATNEGVGGAAPAGDSAVAWFVRPPELAGRLAPLVQGQPDLEWQRRAAVELLADDRSKGDPPPQLFSLYSHEPDSVSHRRFRWHEPERYPFVSRRGIDEFGDAVASTYRRIDDLVGELQGLLGPETLFVIVSDHGQAPTFLHRLHTQHLHGPDGVLLLHGPGIRSGHRLEESHILDVFPTLLALLGLPLPDDAPGRVLYDAFLEPFGSTSPRLSRPTVAPGLRSSRPSRPTGTAAVARSSV